VIRVALAIRTEEAKLFSALSHRSHLLTRGMRLAAAAATRHPPLSTPNWVVNAKTIGLSGAGQARRNCVADTRANGVCHAALPQQKGRKKEMK
jgi:hypothetical protein